MLIVDGGILLGVYLAGRLWERYRKPEPEAPRPAEEPRQPGAMVPAKGETPLVVQADALPPARIALSTVSVALAIATQFFLPALAVVNALVFAVVAYPMLRQSEQAFLRQRKMSAYTLELLIILLAVSQGQLLAAALMIWFFYLGRQILERTQDYSRKTLTHAFVPPQNAVWVLQDGVEVEVPWTELQAGDLVVLNAGEAVPMDGVIAEGTGLVDQHALTGESIPVEKGPGDPVLASTLLVRGKLLVAVEHTGQATVAASIHDLLVQAAAAKSKVQSKGEVFAEQSVKPIVGAGLVALPVIGLPGLMAVLYCNFSNIIRVLASLGTLNHLSVAAHNGILIKDGRALEYLGEVDTVLFDKTGTLTLAELEVHEILALEAVDPDQVLAYAAIAEFRVDHPIARAILAHARARELALPSIDDSDYRLGHGVAVRFQQQTIRVGSARFLEGEGIAMPDTLLAGLDQARQAGDTFIIVARDEHALGALTLRAKPRPEARQVIEGLRERGIRQMLIVSGDHEAPTRKLTEELGLDGCYHDVLPHEKAEIVDHLRQQGRTVCFVGDGINDAVALTQANVSVSLSGATSLATDAAQVVLMDQGLTHLCALFDLAKNLEANLRRTFLSVAAPVTINLLGIFWLHFGLASVILISSSLNLLGLANAMSPLYRLDHEPKKLAEEPHDET